MKIETLHQYFLESSGICTDTRKINKGCLFFALKGENFNGNKFTEEALEKGAFKVVIDDIAYHKNTGETILCGNSLKLLQELAKFHRQSLQLPIIALTGSNGKTTTKELINTVLSKKYNTTATIGNLNNHIGVPLTLLSMTLQTEVGIVEMGANHLKEIEALCDIAQPDFGYITNFGKAHLEGFGSIEGVIKGKTELYKHLKNQDKTVFVNGNDPLQMEMSRSMNRITFGNNSQHSNIQLKNASESLVVSFNDIEIQSHLIGTYNFHNIAAAIAIGEYFNVPSQEIKEAIEGYIPSNNRSQLIDKGQHKIILDAYNANPSSMVVAIENFLQSKGKNKVFFLGDMFELGAEAENEHQLIVNLLEKQPAIKVFLVGSNFYKTKTTSGNIQKYKTFDDLKTHLENTSLDSSFMLIKASRGMALERILELL